jgi:hypothetical protein
MKFYHHCLFIIPETFEDSTEALIRVTRLGEFSPFGRLFTLGSFFNCKSTKQIWAKYSLFELILTKNVLGYILGYFSQTCLVTLTLMRFLRNVIKRYLAMTPKQ